MSLFSRPPAGAPHPARFARHPLPQGERESSFASSAASRWALVTLCAALAACVPPPPHPHAMHAQACPQGGARMARYELLFGAAELGGDPVTEDEWKAFLDAEVTPRFPDGLTVFEGYGQWKAPDGRISREPSRLLLIWAPASAEAGASLEAIRAAYNARFHQLSVMRVDGAEDCVSF